MLGESGESGESEEKPANRRRVLEWTGGLEVAARRIVEEEYASYPELKRFGGTAAVEKSVSEAVYHLSFLNQALALGSPSIFIEYGKWTKVLLSNLGLPDVCLEGFFETASRMMPTLLPPEQAHQAGSLLDETLKAVRDTGLEPESYIDPSNPRYEILVEYQRRITMGDRRAAVKVITAAVEGGVPVKDIYMHVFQPFQYEVGRLWHLNRLSVAQEHFYTASTQLAMSMLYDYIFTTEKSGLTTVATCVSDELHEIGIRMVADYMEASGWDTFYLGANMPPAAVVDTVASEDADVLAVSATLPTNVSKIEEIIRLAKDIRPDVKTIVGGPPFMTDRELWRKIGADGTAANFEEGLAVTERLVRS